MFLTNKRSYVKALSVIGSTVASTLVGTAAYLDSKNGAGIIKPEVWLVASPLVGLGLSYLGRIVKQPNLGNKQITQTQQPQQ